MPERMTRDFNILDHHQDGEIALACLKEAGYQRVSELSIPGYMFNAPDGTEVELLLIPFPWIEEALQPGRTDAAGYPVLDLPYLVLIKMETSRTQDLADLSKMLGLANEEDLRLVRETVARLMPDAAEDLESLIHLGGLEMNGT